MKKIHVDLVYNVFNGTDDNFKYYYRWSYVEDGFIKTGFINEFNGDYITFIDYIKASVNIYFSVECETSVTGFCIGYFVK